MVALGRALREGSCTLKAVGLGRTGMTDRDAKGLAKALRARHADSPLEEVEVREKGRERGREGRGVGESARVVYCFVYPWLGEAEGRV